MTGPENFRRRGSRIAAQRVLEAQAFRVRAAELAESLVDLGANPVGGLARERYLELIAPGETAARVAEMAEMCGDGLVAAGFWRALGVQHPLLEAPYEIGTSMTRFAQIGRQAGALIHATPGLLPIPAPGDVVLVGEGAEEHALIVVRAWRPPVGPEEHAVIRLESVDGGQRDHSGYQAIERRLRVWSVERGEMVDRARAVGGSWGKARVVQGWIDLLGMVGRFGARVAPGKDGEG